MKILIAADGSAYTRRMLAYLAAHDEWLGSLHRYTVLYAVAPVPARAAAAVGRETVEGFYADEAAKVFKPIRSFFKKQGLEAAFLTKTGPAADVISKVADSGKYDLVLMGSHGYGTLGNLVIGSVTTKVLARCKTPVLLVR